MADTTVDARNLQCPMPVVKMAMAINDIQSGQTLELIATDRGALSDIPAWAKDTGNSLKEQFEENAEFHFIIEKA
jgi:tRNA 2-thiouridine synthesizing protein A